MVLKISYLNLKDFAVLSIFINVGSQQRSNAGHPKRKEQLPLNLRGEMHSQGAPHCTSLFLHPTE